MHLEMERAHSIVLERLLFKVPSIARPPGVCLSASTAWGAPSPE